MTILHFILLHSDWKQAITKFCDGGEKLEGIPVVTVVKTEFTGAQPGATSTEIGIQELNI